MLSLLTPQGTVCMYFKRTGSFFMFSHFSMLIPSRKNKIQIKNVMESKVSEEKRDRKLTFRELIILSK